MRKFSFRALFVVLLIVASISAQVFVSEQSASQPIHVEHQVDEDSLNAPDVQLDIEILKTLIKHGKNHLPVISDPTEF